MIKQYFYIFIYIYKAKVSCVSSLITHAFVLIAAELLVHFSGLQYNTELKVNCNKVKQKQQHLYQVCTSLAEGSNYISLVSKTGASCTYYC